MFLYNYIKNDRSLFTIWTCFYKGNCDKAKSINCLAVLKYHEKTVSVKELIT